MKSRNINTDQFIGLEVIPAYTIRRYIGSGKIGHVFYAKRDSPSDEFACKIIERSRLKFGWDRELQKLGLLRRVPFVVQYHQHGDLPGSDKYIFVLYDFVPGSNLKEFINANRTAIDMAFVERVVWNLLSVLLACSRVGIEHGDLHSGNILVSDPDDRLPGSPRTIWVNDFGYGGSHNGLQPKDDHRQTVAVVVELLSVIDPAELTLRDRAMHSRLQTFLRKTFLEVDPSQRLHRGNPESLLDELKNMGIEAERQSAVASTDTRISGDFLWAEALGYSAQDWKHLFVPKFLGAEDLLSRNITILTGARGCGKTMAFRRLTAYMDALIGGPSGVEGADQFIGCYLNCRDIAEAFPYLPGSLSEGVTRQLLHYFHLSWFAELVRTLAIVDQTRADDYTWLDRFIKLYFKSAYASPIQGASTLDHVRAFIDNQKELCRSTPPKRDSRQTWPIDRLDFLDILQTEIQNNVVWIGTKPLYFFLDDYTIPIIPREVQRSLNPVIFKRRSKLFFKVSTEAANSFHQFGMANKPLELHHDFKLIDLANETLHKNELEKKRLLDSIFRPRIDWNKHYNKINGTRAEHEKLGLVDVLGTMRYDNNELSTRMRDASQGIGKRQVVYSGVEAFIGMWTSDIRIMIEMFVDLLRSAADDLEGGELKIRETHQNKVYRRAGGEFLKFAESTQEPSYWESGPGSTKPGEPYGRQLREVAQAFIQVSRFEMTHGKLVSNQEKEFPRQAFRIEIVDELALSAEAQRYYDGLVRWHIFLSDWSGKSIRGMITPKLYLNKVLIPYANLTFSKRDSLLMSCFDFEQLLLNPTGFLNFYRNKAKAKEKRGDLSTPADMDAGQLMFEYGGGGDIT